MEVKMQNSKNFINYVNAEYDKVFGFERKLKMLRNEAIEKIILEVRNAEYKDAQKFVDCCVTMGLLNLVDEKLKVKPSPQSIPYSDWSRRMGRACVEVLYSLEHASGFDSSMNQLKKYLDEWKQVDMTS